MRKAQLLTLVALCCLSGRVFGQQQLIPPANPIPGESLAPVIQEGFADGSGGDGNGGPRFWAEASWVLYWLKPVCLTVPTMSVGSPSDAVPGALGQPGTLLVQGLHKFQFPGANGIRPRLGAWLTEDRFLCAEVEGFVLEQVAAGQPVAASATGPPTFLVFQNPDNSNRALPFTIPGVVSGNSSAVGTSRLWSLEGNLGAHIAVQRGPWTVDATLLAGSRFLELDDRVIVTNTQALVANPTVTAQGQANFSTRNQFTGGQLGSRIGMTRGQLTLEATTKIAVGESNMTTFVSGSPLTTGNSILPPLIPGPVLVQPSNFGRSGTERIAVVPEANIRLRWRVNDLVQLTVGYNILYWSKILCPGDQMDPRVNVTQLPYLGPPTGPTAPKQVVVFTDEFAQGIEAGLGLSF